MIPVRYFQSYIDIFYPLTHTEKRAQGIGGGYSKMTIMSFLQPSHQAERDTATSQEKIVIFLWGLTIRRLLFSYIQREQKHTHAYLHIKTIIFTINPPPLYCSTSSSAWTHLTGKNIKLDVSAFTKSCGKFSNFKETDKK